MLRLPHPTKQLSFVLLSLADLVLTWALIRDDLGHVYESNPVAAWCLHRQGWAGLAMFKVLMVLTSIGLSIAISRRRPRTGGSILILGCVITACVVLYSSYLYLDVTLTGADDELRQVHEQIAQSRSKLDRVMRFHRLQELLADELASGRRSLSEALAEYEPASHVQTGAWLDELRRSDPSRSLRESLAVHLMSLSLAKRTNDPQAARVLAQRLEDEYRSLFGTPPSRRSQTQWALVRMQETLRGS